LLNPNIILGGALAAFMSCIEHSAWFDEQQLDLLFGGAFATKTPLSKGGPPQASA
jgi:hypothetical protein